MPFSMGEPFLINLAMPVVMPILVLAFHYKKTQHKIKFLFFAILACLGCKVLFGPFLFSPMALDSADGIMAVVFAIAVPVVYLLVSFFISKMLIRKFTISGEPESASPLQSAGHEKKKSRGVPVWRYIVGSLMVVLVVLCLIMFLDKDYIPPGQYRLERDPYDPKLHDQVVHFNVPMVYVLLDESDIGDYAKETVDIGRTLDSEASATGPGGEARRGHAIEKIPMGMKFTIKGSYWHRRDWLGRELGGDTRKIILVDEDGVLSDNLFVMLYKSDRRDLLEFENEGRYKK